jgi:eukaryotic-like serine/threonine-protein kinase
MGEVYRAKDTRLNRTVAIKVLPDELSRKPGLRQRFEREARAIASLNHPHICALYDVGQQEGVDFLVMEYLEGETLAERLSHGALKTEQLLRYAIQIADALDKAHRQGFVHRDLKPGNIMLTRAGVKLLDFGLATLARDGKGPGGSISGTAATLTMQPLTAEGTIVGTLPYMAPEQLEGKETDTRTDIFAFGAILYEMATGKRAFEGKSQASLIAAILAAEPKPMRALQPLTPPVLERVVQTCLAKDPEERWQNARDIMRELEWIAEGESQAGVSALTLARHTNRERFAWAIVAIAVLTVLAMAALYFRRAPLERGSTVRFFITPPEKATITHERDTWHFLAVSPDGRQVAFIATLEGKKLLWVRSLDALSAQALPGTEGALSPFWSPTSRTIGFFADGKLKKVELAGGPPQTLCDVSAWVSNGTWGRQGTILFDNWGRGPQGIYAVPATGGQAVLVTTPDNHGKDLAWPHFLPDGRHFLYCGYDLASNNSSIYVASLDSHEARRVMQADSRVAYAPPGYLLYLREGTLLGQPFDAEKLRLVGEPFQVAERLDYFKATGYGAFSVSESGVLSYVAGEPISKMVWLNRSGGEIGSIGAPGAYKRLRLSPDGRKVAVEIRGNARTGTADLWIYESSRDLTTRFTFDPETTEWSPVWSPDGRRLVFSVDGDGPPHLYQKLLSGAGSEEMLLPAGGIQIAHDWSPDGRFILYEDSDPKTGLDLWILPMLGERKPVPFLRSVFNETDARFSRTAGGSLLFRTSREDPKFTFSSSRGQERNGLSPVRAAHAPVGGGTGKNFTISQPITN